MSAYTEDRLIEQPAIQLMQHELGWDVVNCYDEWSSGGNIEHRTPNIEHRSEEIATKWTDPALSNLAW